MDERGEFYALTAPLPADVRLDLGGFWDIGEQEGALAGLISALRDADAPLTDSARGRIAVLAEAWGCWEALGGPLAACRGNAQAPETAALVENTAEGVRLDTAIAEQLAVGNPWPGHAVVAWFACRRCPDLLVRVHKTEPWGRDLIASAYVLLHTGDDGTGRRSPLAVKGSHHTGWPAFTALVSTHHR